MRLLTITVAAFAFVACTDKAKPPPPKTVSDLSVSAPLDLGSGGGECMADADCNAGAPMTTPASCAEAFCDHGTCMYRAVDADGDHHRTAACASSDPAKPVQKGDDCDDSDATTFPGAPQICDGKDHTCGSTTAPKCTCSVGATQSCYTGPSGTEKVGACKAGTQVCTGTSPDKNSWGDCVGETVPFAGLPDKDHPCNGTNWWCDVNGVKPAHCAQCVMSDPPQQCGGSACATFLACQNDGTYPRCTLPNNCECNSSQPPQSCSAPPYACAGSQTCVNSHWGSCTPTGACECTTGAVKCSGNGTAICQGNKWSNATPCIHQTCNPNDNACEGECGPGDMRMCTVAGVGCPGMQSCVGGYYGTCNPTGSCQCTNGQTRCNGNSSQVCQGNAWGAITGCNHQTCNPNSGLCEGVCGPGDLSCSGNQPISCNSSGQWQGNGQACVNQTCDPGSGQCRGQCDPQAHGCQAIPGCNASCDGSGQCHYACTEFPVGTSPNWGCSNLCFGASCNFQYVATCPTGTHRTHCDPNCVSGCCKSGSCGGSTSWNTSSDNDGTCNLHIGTRGCDGTTESVTVYCQGPG